MKNNIRKSIFKKILLVFVLFVIPTTYYWYEKVFAISEFQRVGQVKFPMGVYVESWEETGFTLHGQFKIEENQIEQFKADNQLQPAVEGAKTIYVLNRCYNDRHNQIDLKFDTTTLIADIKLETTDFAGDPICDL
tara:strand:- start:61783 stop:62187 length:405 start_codon:yes stop_codon:yes gene_type:complete